MNWIRANLRYWYLFIKIVVKHIQNLFISLSLAWPWRKWCCDCSFYGQLAQAHVGHTQNHSTRGSLSTGHCTAKHRNATCRLSVHLWYEFVQIFQFRLRSVAEDFNVVEGKCAAGHCIKFIFFGISWLCNINESNQNQIKLTLDWLLAACMNRQLAVSFPQRLMENKIETQSSLLA